MEEGGEIGILNFECHEIGQFRQFNFQKSKNQASIRTDVNFFPPPLLFLSSETGPEIRQTECEKEEEKKHGGKKNESRLG